MTRAHVWLGIGSAVAACLGLARLVLDVTGSVLGTSVSCGDAYAYLAGADNAHRAGLIVCGGVLHDASAEGLGLLVLAAALAVASIVSYRRHVLVPGWYTVAPGSLAYWDGRQWTAERPIWPPPRWDQPPGGPPSPGTPR